MLTTIGNWFITIGVFSSLLLGIYFDIDGFKNIALFSICFLSLINIMIIPLAIFGLKKIKYEKPEEFKKMIGNNSKAKRKSIRIVVGWILNTSSMGICAYVGGFWWMTAAILTGFSWIIQTMYREYIKSEIKELEGEISTQI